MHPIHIKIFWWPRPRLAQEQVRDIARLVRWFGLVPCVLWLRSPQNELRNPRLLLTRPPAWEERNHRFQRLAPLWWKTILPTEKWMVTGFAAFAVGGTIYVGDLSVLVYMGGAILLWWLLYFGSLFLALIRWHHWLKAVAGRNAALEPEPTEIECRELVMNHCRAAADLVVDDEAAALNPSQGTISK